MFKLKKAPHIEEKTSASFPDSKPHYHILDGLRGVAALMVILFHFFEAFATSPIDQKFNHGYLAVDFFFILSGFVVGYAYDNRWQKMTTLDFFKRRIIRLHPMVIAGVILGAITFYIQGSQQWSGTSVTLSILMLSTLFGLFLIPVTPGMTADVRGNGEMFPLNGPSWSLFFEYIGNILYGIILRKLPTKLLAIFVALMGIGLATFALGNFSDFGHIGVGWSLGGTNLPGGLLRVLFSFSAGLLLSRIFKPANIKGAFIICTIAIIALLSVPHIGGKDNLWMNAVYDCVCVILVFPLLVYIGASGKTTNKTSTKICNFLGNISYPVYIIHYPFMYLFYAYCWGNGIFARDAGVKKLSFDEVWHIALLIFVGVIILSYLFLKFYDEPIRKKLSKTFLTFSNKKSS